MDMFQQFPNVPEIIHNITENTCFLHLFKTGENLLKGSLWALQMVDASTKVPGSVLLGDLVDFGNFDECIDVKVQEKWGSFLGQHCLIKLHPDANTLQRIEENVENRTAIVNLDQLAFRISVCVPSTCSAQELTTIFRNLLGHNATVAPKECHTIERDPLTGLDWLGIGVLLFLVLLCFASTMYDLLLSKSERKNKLLSAFSIPLNAKKLFSISCNADMMHSMNGVRVISMMSIVFGHRFLLMFTTPAINLLQYMEEARDFGHTIIETPLFAVDTFFVMSGCLLCYIFLNTFDGPKRFNLFGFYIHRYMRLTPLLAVIVILHLSLLNRMGHAPLWDSVMEHYVTRACQRHWWSTLLYINNYVHTENMCVPTSWYLAVDMQLFWISPVFLLTLRKWPRIGLWMMLVAALVGICVAFQASWVHQDSPNIIRGWINVYTRYFYTHLRYVPWLLGLFLGYVFYITKDWRKKVHSGSQAGIPMGTPKCVFRFFGWNTIFSPLTECWVAIGWTFSATALLTAIFIVYPMNQPEWVYNQVEASLYLSLSRPLWSLGICWLLFACVSGHGGIVNTFLSWKAFQPLSRLSYAIYLVHAQVIFMRVYASRTPNYLSDMLIVGHFFGDLVFSTVIALSFTLLIESPLLNIEKLLLKRDKPPKQQNGLSSILSAPEWKTEVLTSNIIPSSETTERQP